MAIGRAERRSNFWVGLDDKLRKAANHRERQGYGIPLICSPQLNELKKRRDGRHSERVQDKVMNREVERVLCDTLNLGSRRRFSEIMSCPSRRSGWVAQ